MIAQSQAGSPLEFQIGSWAQAGWNLLPLLALALVALWRRADAGEPALLRTVAAGAAGALAMTVTIVKPGTGLNVLVPSEPLLAVLAVAGVVWILRAPAPLRTWAAIAAAALGALLLAQSASLLADCAAPHHDPLKPARRAADAGSEMARDHWTEAHVRRLFWRAGFGATSKQARYWAQRSKGETIDWLMRGGSGPPRARFPAPRIDGKPLDPANEYGQDVLWWLDKMVRTPRPLVEKMTLFWHDHFATLDQDRPLQLAQNKMLRRNALGSFRRLLTDVTKDPAMLLFLSLADSTKDEPNENYARELMELFTLGKGYTEHDIREAARALTGFRSKRRGDGSVAVLYDARAHDATAKKLFGKRGNFDYRDVLDLCIAHPQHAPFLVSKLWDYFVGTPIEPSTRKRLAGIYRRNEHRIAPVVRNILESPALYRGLGEPDVVKSPVVYVAGMLRACGEGVTRADWVYLLDGMGQLPFRPPSVAGWDWGTAWLSTNTMHVRFDTANVLLRDRRGVKDGTTPKHDSPRETVARARSAVGRPWTSSATDAKLLKLATTLLSDDPAPAGGYRMDPQQRADMCQRVLRQLLLTGPDAQVH